MRHRLISARGSALAAVLLLASSVASGAPAKRAKSAGKAKQAPPVAASTAREEAPPASAKASEDGPTPEASNQVTPEPESKPEPVAPSSFAPGKAPASGEPSGSLASAAPSADGQATASVHEALGRREARRLLLGRTEVGVSFSMDIGNRRFKYSDELGASLRRYTLPVAPMASVGLEAYPFTASDVPVLRDLGFRGRFSHAFGMDSTTPDGDKLQTTWTRYGGEVRERLLISGERPMEFGALFGADASYFEMRKNPNVTALLPNARTLALRFGLDGRVLVGGRFSALLGIAYLRVTSPGEIYDRFREPHVAGFDGELGGSVAILPGLEARLAGRYTRYFAAFHPQVGDRYVAGGALDEQLQVGLGVRYAH